ncbi:MAG: CpsB/CapC family capsule biosynthesis tyrosine phosphatase [Bacillota bacterium]
MPSPLQKILPSRRRDVAYSDVHCHVLPGLDDGPKDAESSLKLARMASESGARRIVATPHFLPGVFEPSPADIRLQIRLLNERLAQENIEVEVMEGCEAYLSERLCRDYKDGKILTIGGSRHVLVELPSMSLPPGALDELFALRVLGAGVILAHPERNLDLCRNPALTRELAENGILLQVNAGSLMGVYGREADAFASSLFREGLVHFIGSDAHSGRSADLRSSGPDIRPALRKAFRSQRDLERFISEMEERFDRLTTGRDSIDR